MRLAHLPFSQLFEAGSRDVLSVISRPAELRSDGPLLGVDAFYAAGRAVLGVARARNLDVALLLAHVPELAEVETLFGHRAAHEAAHILMANFSHLAGFDGVAARTSRRSFAVLKPRRTADQLLEELRSQMGKACAIEFMSDDEELVLVPHLQAVDVDDDESLERCFVSVRRAIASTEHSEQVRCEAMRRERERHSTLMSLPHELR